MKPTSAKVKTHLAEDRRSQQEVCLLTINGPAMSTPLRLVSDVVKLVRGTDVYEPFPFDYTFPPEDEAMSAGRITVQNVSKHIGDIVRNAKGPIDCTLELVLREDPTNPIRAVPRLKMRSAQVTNTSAQFSLERRSYPDSAWPGTRANPDLTPGLHE